MIIYLLEGMQAREACLYLILILSEASRLSCEAMANTVS